VGAEDETRPDMPAQPKTATFAAADKNEILLAEIKATVGSKVDRLEANLELQGGEIGLIKREVSLLYDWRDGVDERLRSNSMRARGASQVDLEQAKALSDEVTARESLKETVDDLAKSNAVQLAILERLDKVAKHPTVKIVLAIIGFLGASWLAARGLK
jgi:hypothetical protein